MKKINVFTGDISAQQAVVANTIQGTAGADFINGGPGDQIIKGLAGSDILNGLQGNDRLDGGDGNDWLNGGDGSESAFYGEEPNDVGQDYLDGGKGNDRLAGGLGLDTYVWGRGYGNDIIEEKNYSLENYIISSNAAISNDVQVISANTSILKLVNLKPIDIEFIASTSIHSQYFTLRIKSTGETLDWLGEQGITDINVEFANGLKWTTQDLQNQIVQGTKNDDVLIGFRGAENLINAGNGQDFILGGERNDILSGDRGNDDIIGGKGADLINGGAGFDVVDGGEGADQYQFGWGSGTDVLIGSNINLSPGPIITNENDSVLLGKGVRTTDVNILKNGDSLIIQLKGSSDRFEIDGFFTSDNGVRDASVKLIFNDGIYWDSSRLAGKAQKETTRTGLVLEAAKGQQNIAGTQGIDVLVGNDSANTLYGRAGNDVFDSKGGNDHLYGGDGQDTFIFGRNTGQDIIHDIQNDIIRIATGIKPDDIQFDYGLANLELHIKGTSTAINQNGDTLTLNNFLNQTLAPGNEGTHIEFADGTRWTQRQIQRQRLDANDDDNQLDGSDGDDIIDGKGGRDQIFGHAGNDILHGGNGANYISGGTGNDNIFADGKEGSNLNGGLGDDVLVGGDGDDFLFATEGGDDRVIAGGGDDTIMGDYGDDYYDSGTGNDFISDFSGITTIALKGEFGQDIFQGGDASTCGIILELDGVSTDYQFQFNLNNFVIQKGKNQLIIDSPAELSFDTLRGIHFGDGTRWQGNSLGDDFANYLLTAYTTTGSDMITGTPANEVLCGGAGDDVIKGEGGNDSIYGGDGIDNISGGDGQDIIVGGAGDDIVYDISDYNRIFGGGGDDSILGIGMLSGGDGNDTIKAYDNQNENFYNDWINGGDGDDILEGGKGLDTYAFSGGFGADVIYDLDQYNVRFSGDASDFDFSLNDVGNLIISQGRNSVTIKEDFNQFNVGMQSISFGDGYLTAETTRILLGLEDGINPFSDQLIDGTNDVDILAGSFGNDLLSAGGGDDTLNGESGHDILFGDGGNDILFGSAGNDILNGGKGDDVLDGGTGINTYEINAGDGNDVIKDAGRFNLLLGNGIGLDDLTASFYQEEIKLQWGDGQSLVFYGDPLSNLLQIDSLTIEGATYSDFEAAKLINNKLNIPLTGLDNQAAALVNAMAAFSTPRIEPTITEEPYGTALNLSANGLT